MSDETSRHALRYLPGVPPECDPRDPRCFLFLAGFKPAAPVVRAQPPIFRTTPPPGSAVVRSLMEAELLLQELEEQPREPET